MNQATAQIPKRLPKKDLLRVITIKPGTSSEKSVKIILPQEKYNSSVEDVIDYILNKDDLKRNDERIADRVKNEMKKEYGITVNANSIFGNEKIQKYFTKTTSPKGTEYFTAEIIIAAHQEGGLEYKLSDLN